MIAARLFDLGTRYTGVNSGVPGMTEPRYLQVSMYEDALEDRSRQINDALLEVSPAQDCVPWPEQMPRKCWVDTTQRYIDPHDGIRFNLRYHVPVVDDYTLAPAGDAVLVANPDPEVDRADGRITKWLRWPDVQDVRGPDWIRLDATNHAQGGLTAPACLNLTGGYRGGAVALELPDNTLFAPWDLSELDRYLVYRELPDGDLARLSAAEAARETLLRDRGLYSLYLRPRRWEWSVLMQVDYLYVSFVEHFIFSLFFTFRWYDRPPFWPRRHNIFQSGGEPDAVDAACYEKLNNSEATAMMRSEIMKLQLFTPCEVITFLRAHPAEVTIWRIPERARDICLGIGRVDKTTGLENRVWLRYATEQTRYPKTQVAYWHEVPIYITI